MDDSCTDILEITVHGTQAVCMKIEEVAVCIKEEEESASEVEDLKEIKDDTIRFDLTSVPLVYTTRLDQMNAFSKIGSHTSKEATEMILVESKPHYEHIPKQIKREPLSDSYITSYIQLCSHVQDLNTKAKTETYKRIEKLKEMCKPLKIVLEDIKTNNTSKKMLECTKYTECSSEEDAPPSYYFEEYVPSSFSSDEDVPLSKSISYPICVSKAETTKGSFITTIAIKDKRSQEADIYILDAFKGVKSYYRTSMDECNTLQKLHESKKTILLEYCCWVNREKRIKSLIQTGFARASVSIFLRKPHSCLPRPCTCCCVFGTPMPKKPSNVEFIKHSNKKSVTDVSVSTNNVIEKANNYIPKEPAIIQDMILKTDDEPTDYLKWAVIIFKYQRVIFAQTGLLGENYEIGDKGDINHHLKPTVNRSITEEKELYRRYDETNKISRIYFSYLICCWHNREDIIVKLSDCSKLSPRSLRFIRTSHQCRSDKCECCCKPIPYIRLPLVNVTTQKNTNIYSKKQIKVKVPAKNDDLNGGFIYYKTPTQHGNLEEKIDKNLETQNIKKATNKPAAPRKTNKSTNTPRSARKTSKSTYNSASLHKQGTIVYKSIDLTTESCIRLNTTPTQTKQTQDVQLMDVTSHQKGGNTSNCDSVNLTDVKTTRATLLNGILDKFQDLKLAVNENGKLTAMINTPPGQLSTAEIKVLSDILSLAATQIAELGITPEEFCIRVNSSRSLNGHTNLPMPQLTPISDVPIVNKATTNLHNDSRSPDSCATNPTLTKSVQNVRRRNTQGCKTEPFNSLFPTTHNRSQVSGTYQMMSSLGGLKNQHMVSAYKLHFTDKLVRADLPSVERLQSNEEKQILKTPKIAEVYSLADNRPKKTIPSVRAPAPKRKKPQKVNQNLKKLHMKPPEELTLKDPQPPYQSLRVHRLPFVTSMDQSIINQMKETEHNQTQLFVSNSNLIHTQNTSGTDAPPTLIGTEHNQIPLYISNSNFIPIQNTSGTDALPTLMKTEHNQIPLYISNTNFIPIQNTSNVVIPDECILGEMPTRPTHAVNPMLHQMLSQNTPSPRLPALAPLTPRILAPMVSVRPFILEHTQGPYKKMKRRMKKSNEAPVPKKVVQLKHINPMNTDNEMDIETSLKTNVIQMIRPDQAISDGEITHRVALDTGVVNNIAPHSTVTMEPILIDDDDDVEEEGIFGV